MIRVLANDGIDDAGKQILNHAGFEVVTDKIAQDKLSTELKRFDAILVRSATKITKEIINSAPNLKAIGRAGVGMDNIEVAYAREKGIHVINTPEASSDSVAELVMASMYTMARGLHYANRSMPSVDGASGFNALKKELSNGIELRGKTLGIIGFGRIGKALARMALSQGMRVMPHTRHGKENSLSFDHLEHLGIAPFEIKLKSFDFLDVLEKSDFISLHVSHSSGAPAIMAENEFKLMKDGSFLINAARGGVINEEDLMIALDNGKIKFVALDVFENEPNPSSKVLNHSKISLSPHIGASTKEAQKRIGIELANKIVHAINNTK